MQQTWNWLRQRILQPGYSTERQGDLQNAKQFAWSNSKVAEYNKESADYKVEWLAGWIESTKADQLKISKKYQRSRRQTAALNTQIAAVNVNTEPTISDTCSMSNQINVTTLSCRIGPSQVHSRSKNAPQNFHRL